MTRLDVIPSRLKERVVLTEELNPEELNPEELNPEARMLMAALVSLSRDALHIGQ